MTVEQFDARYIRDDTVANTRCKCTYTAFNDFNVRGEYYTYWLLRRRQKNLQELRGINSSGGDGWDEWEM